MAHRCATGISAGTEERWVETTDVAGAGLLEAVCPKCWATAWGPGSMYFAFQAMFKPQRRRPSQRYHSDFG